jgi:glycosyltransferase involved in cell wall biosynthesis
MPDRKSLSIVSPAYNEGAGILEFYKVVSKVCENLSVDVSFVLVDDGSSDDTWDHLKTLGERNANVRSIKLSRNFGKEAAIVAGLSNVTADAAIVIDADLQHSPLMIPQMVELWGEGFEVVEAVKSSRTGQGLLNRWASKSFNKLFTRLTKVDLVNATDYRLLTRKAIDAVLSMGEQAMFFRGTSSWIGFNRARIETQILDRAAGETKWKFSALVRLGLNAITGFTTAPLHIMTAVSAVFAIFSILLGANTIWSVATGVAVAGYATVLITLLLIGTAVTFGLGIIGEYLARIYDETRKRPRYMVEDIVERRK